MASTQFIILFYFFFLTSILIYILPIAKNISNFVKLKKNSSTFEYISGFDIYLLTFLPIFLSLILTLVWTFPITSIWFGNLIISSLQIKLSYLIFLFAFIILCSLTLFIYFNSREVYDFFLVLINFIFWLFVIFFSNNFFSLIFLIEITSTLIFLMFVTSTFSSNYFYNNLNLNIYNYFNNSSPLFFIQAVIFFFWTSLLSSLNLFLSLIFFYIKFFTLEWGLLESVFFYFTNTSNIKDLIFLNFVWYNFLFCFFLKCGIVPFYFWKPSFFKGLAIHFLYIYIVLFYFLLLLLILIFFIFYLNEIFYFFIATNAILTLIGFLVLFFILSEAFYIKTFLAISSTLNTLFIFLSLNSTSLIDFFFII
jgi:hypothetical protein